MPKRGAAALFLTTIALVLLLNFQTPSDQGLTRFAPRTLSGGAAAVAPLRTPAPNLDTTGDSGSNSGSGSNPGSDQGTGSNAGSGPDPGSGNRTTDGTGQSGATTTPKPTARPNSGSTGLADGTITGQDVPTRFGDVQVQVTISGGKIADITAVALPFDHPRSAEISQYVEPILRNEALQAQTANIDVISGATYTSIAYSESLQSALDQARGS